MKKGIISIGFLLPLLLVFSQDYLITFGVEGYDEQPDSVRIYYENQNRTIIISGDAVLHLVDDITGTGRSDSYDNLVKTYPNPFEDRINIEFNHLLDEQVYIIISDLAGRVVLSQELNAHQRYISVDMPALSRGSYLLNIKGGGMDHAALIVAAGSANLNTAVHISVEPGPASDGSAGRILLKSEEAESELINVQYNDGDQLVFTGYVSQNIAEDTLIPTGNQEISFDFAPLAGFYTSDSSWFTGAPVQFTDTSVNHPDGWAWDFGDGEASTSQNPVHIYSTSGRYTVGITVQNRYGSSSDYKEDYIIVHPLVPLADFSADPTDHIIGSSVQFTDLTQNEPASWLWDFGDGNLSTLQDPVHSYASTGIYTVNLIVGNETGTDTVKKVDFIRVNPEVPIAEFWATPTSLSTGESVQFTDLTQNEPVSWLWNFGDGQNSTEQSPSHSYSSSGEYTVSLTVMNVSGSDTETKTDYITVSPSAPIADFSATPTSLLEGESVQFSDQSVNEVSSWLWDFGDGHTSTQENPNHTYYTAGYYAVSLTVSNPIGTHTEIKADYIQVDPEIPGTVSDIDGNTYNTIVLGNQLWMAENLKTTRYSDGSEIPHVEDAAAWDALSSSDPAYCWYANNPSTGDLYGGIYNWAAAMNGASSSDANPSGVQGVCPAGWHLPSDAEWIELEMYLGMSYSEAHDTDLRGTDEGGKLKESGTVHWYSPNTGATNESGFTALPSGFRRSNGEFEGRGYFADIWSSTDDGSTGAFRRFLPYHTAQIFRGPLEKDQGFSVRCLKD